MAAIVPNGVPAHSRSAPRNSSPRNCENGGDVPPRVSRDAQAEKLSKQVFVGGLPTTATQQSFREWAEEAWPGVVKSVDFICAAFASEQAANSSKSEVMRSKPRGFGFVSFTDAAAATHAAQTQFRTFGAKKVEVKKAEDVRENKRTQSKFARSGGSSHDHTQKKNGDHQKTVAHTYPSGPAELGTSENAVSGKHENQKSVTNHSEGPTPDGISPTNVCNVSQDTVLGNSNYVIPSSPPQQISSTPRNGKFVRPKFAAQEADSVVAFGETNASKAPLSSGRGRTQHKSNLDRKIKDCVNNGQLSPTPLQATAPVEVAAPSSCASDAKQPHYDDCVRKFLRERWEAAARG